MKKEESQGREAIKVTFKIDTVPEILHSLIKEGIGEEEANRKIRFFYLIIGRMPYNAPELRKRLEREVE